MSDLSLLATTAVWFEALPLRYVGCQPDYDTRPPALPGPSWRLAVISVTLLCIGVAV